MGDSGGESGRDAVLRAAYILERLAYAGPVDARRLAAETRRPEHEVAAWLRVCEADGLLRLAAGRGPANPVVEALTPAGRQYARAHLRP